MLNWESGNVYENKILTGIKKAIKLNEECLKKVKKEKKKTKKK